MDAENILETIIPLIAIVLFMVVNIFLKRRTTEKTELGKVAVLLSEINQNLKIIDAFSFTLGVKKFKTGSWTRNQDKLDFLDERLRTNLARAFGMAEEFNQNIDAAKKHKSSSYLASIEADKLKEALTKSQQELGDWFNKNKESKELLPKKRRLFGR